MVKERHDKWMIDGGERYMINWCSTCKMDLVEVPCEHGIVVLMCPSCKRKHVSLGGKRLIKIKEIAKEQNKSLDEYLKDVLKNSNNMRRVS